MTSAAYAARRTARSRRLHLRGLQQHVLEWGEPSPRQPPLLMLHGWMDVAASFQFVVDALRTDRHVLALDWRGFGDSEAGAADSFWFPDYLADLDALLAEPALGFDPARPVDLLGHSMGGNVAMLYAGVRPARIRRLVNLEGFGMPDMPAMMAPTRLAQWLDELRTPAGLRPYASLEEVAARLQANNPLLSADKAAWLAPHWARETAPGRWELRAHPAHKHVNPVLSRKEEALACWRRITAPVLWVDGDRTDMSRFWGTRYTREEFEARLTVVPQLTRSRLSPAGHMLHHDQPQALAERLEAFLEAP